MSQTCGHVSGSSDPVRPVCISLAVSPDGQRLASADVIGNILLWDISPWAKSSSDQPALAKPEPAASDDAQDIETDEGIVISLKPNQPVTKLQREKALRQALKILMEQ